MHKNTDRDSSKLLLSNGSTINISNLDSKKNDADVKINPVTGNFVTTGNSYSGSFQTTDYREQFENKRQALHDIVEDGDGITKGMVRDLVKTANLAVWQESNDGSC